MTRGELIERCSNSEMIHWWIYYSRKAQREELAMLRAKR